MNVLIIEDHPLTANAYQKILSESNNKKINIVNARDCKQAYYALCRAKETGQSFELAVIDYSIPAYREKNLFSGADVAVLIKKCCTECKLLMITAHYETLIIYDLVRKINPLGLATKNDLTVDNLYNIFNDILGSKMYRSPHIKACVQWVWDNNLTLDTHNREILYYLGKGYRIKDLEAVISLSSSAIQNRILKLKKVFGVKDERELIRKLKDENFL